MIHTIKPTTLTHVIGLSITLAGSAADQIRWTYVYGGKPKPFFHPVCTPAGHCLTLFEPHDHLWHRGLWFTIKFINGHNFWEEHVPFGIQQTVSPPNITHSVDGQIGIQTVLDWTYASGETEQVRVFREQRHIVYEQLEVEAYALDWETTLTAQADLVLDRTPFTTWGGYGGLTFRGNRNWQETRLLFPDGSTNERPTGIPANWCDLSGKLDGGLNLTGGIAIFDHPDNPRHPSPWYGATGAGHYFNAAFLFHEPMHVAHGQSLTFRYRVLVHDGIWDVSRFQAAYVEYIKE